MFIFLSLNNDADADADASKPMPRFPMTLDFLIKKSYAGFCRKFKLGNIHKTLFTFKPQAPVYHMRQFMFQYCLATCAYT